MDQVGIEQMKKLPLRVKLLRNMWEQYYRRLSVEPRITFIGGGPSSPKVASWSCGARS